MHFFRIFEGKRKLHKHDHERRKDEKSIALHKKVLSLPTSQPPVDRMKKFKVCAAKGMGEPELYIRTLASFFVAFDCRSTEDAHSDENRMRRQSIRIH